MPMAIARRRARRPRHDRGTVTIRRVCRHRERVRRERLPRREDKVEALERARQRLTAEVDTKAPPLPAAVPSLHNAVSLQSEGTPCDCETDQLTGLSLVIENLDLKSGITLLKIPSLSRSLGPAC